MNLSSTKKVERIKTVTLPAGEAVPAFGIGTWQMGDDPTTRKEELATLRLSLDLGAGLIDTAEMYGNGRAEELVGEAIEGRREEAFLVTKVLPSNATRQGTIKACERSLGRLKTDHVDLYLLHWPGSIPVSETVEGFVQLKNAGKIRYYGVSNFDFVEMQQIWAAPGGRELQTNQLLYNLSRRNIEWDLFPWMRRHRVPLMAYSPIEQARLLKHPELIKLARKWGLTAAQVALGWLLAQDDVIVIPKTSRRDRLNENFATLQHPLDPQQVTELDRLFPAPKGAEPLEML